jgi:ribosomal protein L27
MAYDDSIFGASVLCFEERLISVSACVGCPFLSRSQLAWPGCIIIRQRGTRFHPDTDGSVNIGKDHTIYAKVLGRVAFRWDPVKRHQVVYVSKLPVGAAEAADVAASAL